MQNYAFTFPEFIAIVNVPGAKMGCVSGKPDINDIHPNIYEVMNVNEMGQVISPGELEIAETELVLYQRGKTPTRWPLRCLRKYGFDSDLFTFECGRRCPTGAGNIYFLTILMSNFVIYPTSYWRDNLHPFLRFTALLGIKVTNMCKLFNIKFETSCYF